MGSMSYCRKWNGTKAERNSSNEDGDGIGCRICYMPAHGLHFGLLTCRACAAFFRRSIAYNFSYTCRLETGQCEVSKNKRFSCRACRLAKCLSLGMKKESVQLNRDKIKNPAHTNLPTVTASINIATKSQPEFDDNQTRNNQQKIDKTIELPTLPESDYKKELPFIKEILKMDMPYYANVALSPICLNGLQRIQLAYYSCLAERPFPVRRPPSDDFPVKGFLITDFIRQSRDDLKLVARFLTTFETFRRLSFNDKWAIFKRFWTNFLTIDRMYDTVCTLGFDSNAKLLVLPDGTFVDIKQGRSEELKKLTDYCHEDLRRIGEPHFDFIFENILEVMRKLRIDDIEFAFAVGCLLWDTQEIDVSEETRQLCEQEKRLLADDLHMHYISKCLHNYAWRLCRLIHICESVQKTIAHRREAITMAKVFDTYKYDVFLAELLE